MSGRLVVISNRLPNDATPQGGLVFALHEALSETGGLWIGADDPRPFEDEALRPIGGKDYEKLVFPLTPDEHAGYYAGYANDVLWPLFHARRDLLQIDAEAFRQYMVVNERVARLVAPLLDPGDRVWIHDYHFLPLAASLRKEGVGNPIGFFLHTPFASASDVHALPQIDSLVDWLAAHDLVGLQTQRDVRACTGFLRQREDVETLIDGAWRHGDRIFSVLSFPIGIDAKAFRRFADANDAPPEIALSPQTPLILGVDRLDYSKGIVQRVQGFGRYLETRDPSTPRPTYIQIAPVSRGDMPAYREVRTQLDEIAGSINGTHATLDWTPVRYVRQNVDRGMIAQLYRRARVCLVTPLADGMNLVAKEYVAAQNDADPGVLVLSRFAGAAEQLDAALLVNPYDTDDIAGAIETALSMPLDERVERQRALAASVFGEDIGWWRRNFLARLDERSSRHATAGALT